MKKLFLGAAVAAMAFSISSANAQCPVCGQTYKLKYDDPTIHQTYVNGDVALDGVVTGLEETGYSWRVKNPSKKKQVWIAADYLGRDVVVKLKDAPKKQYVKVDVLGQKRMFTKNLDNGKKKHTGKVREDGKLYVKKHITNEDGIDIMNYDMPKAKKEAKKAKKNK